jgi:modulator of FtsH protease HflK
MSENRPLSLRGTFRGVLIVSMILWITSGIYVVKADEAGVVRVFGKVQPVPVSPGVHYHWPFPIASVDRPKVTQVKSLSIGFTPEGSESEKDFYVSTYMDEQSEFLTGDQNIIHAKLIVQWSISDPIAFLTQADNPKALLKSTTEAAIAVELSRSAVDDALTSGKVAVINNIRRNVQDRLDALETGVGIVTVDLKELTPPAAVASAFKDVASARGDAARMVHEAEGYENEGLPAARGKAGKMIGASEGYRNEVVRRATGDAERFTLLLTEYRKNPSVTEKRLILETMDEVMPRMKKYLMATQAGERAARMTLFMDELQGTNR